LKLSPNILNNRRIKPLFLVLVFFVIAGFLFLSSAKATHAWSLADILGTLGKPFYDALVIAPLLLILGIVSFLMQASATLFAWIIEPGNQTAVMGRPIIYLTWMMVRDLLNVGFILVLLFSAFATIFQVEKYNYKKLLFNIILMALLVNFSFPIARFIIDASNVLMYTLLNRMTFVGPAVTGGANKAMGALAFGSQFSKMLDTESRDATYLISAIIFGFILAITLLAIGVMFVIRMVALAILIIFSPIAFVGAILPDTASYSNKWWHALFKYAFFGPIMVFMLYISSALIIQMGSLQTMQDFQRNAVNQTSAGAGNPGIIAAISFYSIPIVILWFGMGMAQSSSIAGASMVMGAAQKFSKGAGKKLSGYDAAAKRYGAYKAERKKRADEKFKDNWGSKVGQWANRKQDALLARGGDERAGKRADKTHKDKNKDDIDKGAKDLVDSGATADTLAQQMNTNFGSAPPTTRQEKVEQAKAAAAYLRQDADERKMHIQTTLVSKSGIVGSDIEKLLTAAAPKNLTGSSLATFEAAKTAAQKAAMDVGSGTFNDNDLRVVEAFIKSQMKRTVEKGANAYDDPKK
jgi:hypothetical protein